MFDELSLGYRDHCAVRQLEGELRMGSLTAVVGPNGSGKSTLMKAMAGVLRPLSGTCTLAPGARVAYLPQQSELDRTFPARVIDLVRLGLWPRRGFLGRHGKDDRARVAQALDTLGIGDLARRPIDEISGGQLQRALFARVLLQDANLILLDEPFNAIDAATVADLMRLVRHWHREGRTVVAVLHDLDLVRAHFPQTLVLAGRVLAWGRTDSVLASDHIHGALRFDRSSQADAIGGLPGGRAPAPGLMQRKASR
ncbi:MAG: zinc ABC transporter ATP-binding protein AztA [Rhodocyclaceae bacterium]